MGVVVNGRGGNVYVWWTKGVRLSLSLGVKWKEVVTVRERVRGEGACSVHLRKRSVDCVSASVTGTLHCWEVRWGQCQQFDGARDG